ncbi:hypothetical protein F5Y03DRAFT_403201 [Xylaria venustula]|nr:hypothetical protein F5Y03DRAFT_403201 [Xylaria venustula]
MPTIHQAISGNPYNPERQWYHREKVVPVISSAQRPRPLPYWPAVMMYFDYLAAGLIVVAFERLAELKQHAAIAPITSVVDELYRHAHEAYRAHDFPRAPKEQRESVVVTPTTAFATQWTSSKANIYIATTPTPAIENTSSPLCSPSTPSAPGSPGTSSTTNIIVTTTTTPTTMTITSDVGSVTVKVQGTTTTTTSTTTAFTASDLSTKIPQVEEDKPSKDERRSACDWQEVSRLGSALEHPYKLLTNSETKALDRAVAHAHELRSKLDGQPAKAKGLGEILDYLVIKPLSASCSASLALQWNLKILSQIENQNVTQIWTMFNAALVQVLQPSLHVRSKPGPGKMSSEAEEAFAAVNGESFRDEGVEEDSALFEDVFNLWKGVEKKREKLRDTIIDTKQEILYPSGTTSGVALSVRLIEIAILLPFCVVTAILARLLILQKYRRIGHPRAATINGLSFRWWAMRELVITGSNYCGGHKM